MRVLIVEDDPNLAGLLRDGLRAQRIDPTLAATFAEGRDRAQGGSFDVIILDVRLPGGTGLELCGELRRGGSSTPVLMLTALDALDDRVRGLEVGADGRRPALSPARYRIADLEVDLGTRQVRRRGQPITLSAKEFALLELFVLNQGRVLDRSTITTHVWDDNLDPFANVLEVLVGRLRRKIDDGFEPKLITTLRGAGYRFGT